MHAQTRMMIADAMSNVKSFMFNLLYFDKHSPYDQEWSLLRDLVLSSSGEMRDHYKIECEYVASLSLDALSQAFLPYPVRKDAVAIGEVAVGIEDGFPYVLHGESRRLYFPRKVSCAETVAQYKYLIESEGLLHGGLRQKSPHCYQDNKFFVEEGDVLLDVGCAEALFALDNVDRASNVFLFECAKEWRKPLQLTFRPYANKTVFVGKMISNRNCGKETTITDAVASSLPRGGHYFVKMDIEGGERAVINGNAEFFKNNKVKLSCCCYHRQDDAIVIEKMLNEMGYSTRFSDGYMLTPMNGIHYPYFRRGVIYARNY